MGLSHRRLAIAFLGISIPVIGLGLLRFRSNMEDVLQWLPDSSPAREAYDEFVRRFGSDDFVVVSWTGCTLQDPRADELASALRAQRVDGLIRDARSGRELAVQLHREARLPVNTVLSRFRGFYFGPGNDQTCVLVSLSKLGMADRKAAMACIHELAEAVLQASAETLVVGGYPRVGAYGDQIIRDSVLWLVGPSCLASTLAAWYALRSLGITLGVLAVAGMAALLSIAMVTLSGACWGGLSSAIPTLAYIMTVSGAVHLVNYGRYVPGPDVARQVLSAGWKPSLVSSMTTAAGMLSLCRSEFPAVRAFGMHCAAGVLGAVVCLLFLVPVLLDGLRGQLRQVSRARWPAALLRVTVGHSRLVLLGFLVVGAMGATGLLSLRANLQVERVFRPDTPVMRDIDWLEQSLGPLEQTECILRFPDVSQDTFADRLNIVRDVQAAVEAIPGVHRTLSLVDSLPDEPAGGGVRRTVARTLYRRFVRDLRDQLQPSAYWSAGPSDESWRISLRVPFLQTTNFAELEECVRAAAAQAIAQHAMRPVEVDYTGVSHLYHVTQQALISDLYHNFATAFLLICPCMIMALRSLLLGGLAMIPNVLPALLVFGAIGLERYPIDIGIAMTASVALGIAVDDTTHLLMRFRELEHSEPSAWAALTLAYRQCAVAMLQTTLIASVGLSVFIGGPLLTMTRFAVVLIATLIVALLCDLFLLPALLKEGWPLVRQQREP